MTSSKLIFDNTQISLSVTTLLEQLPCAIGIKTTDSRFIAANQQVAALAGFSNAKHIIGLQDKDVKCPAADLHETFILQDQETLSNNKVSNLDICKYSDGRLHVFLSVKSKLIDNNSKQFILFTMTELPIGIIAKIMTDCSANSIIKDSKLCASYRIQNTKVHTSDNSEYVLSKRLSECLFLLLQGKPMKAIAHVLQISAKTVEEHINRLKLIFQCNTKAQLIEKAFSLGYAQIIPPSLLS